MEWDRPAHHDAYQTKSLLIKLIFCDMSSFSPYNKILLTNTIVYVNKSLLHAWHIFLYIYTQL